MTMDEKYNCTERARINDHEAVRGCLNTPVVSGRYSDRLLETIRGNARALMPGSDGLTRELRFDKFL
jgi:hypothetical protein